MSPSTYYWAQDQLADALCRLLANYCILVRRGNYGDPETDPVVIQAREALRRAEGK